VRRLSVERLPRLPLQNPWGDSHALTIQWVCVGNPLHVHMRNTTLPLGNVGEYTIISYLTDICYHFLRHAVHQELIHVNYVATDNMAADIFTKALPQHKVLHLNELVGLRLA
jgi:hypothetical protein